MPGCCYSGFMSGGNFHRIRPCNRGGGGGCPMSSMGMFGIGTSVDGSRIYTGEASWTKVERRLDD